MDPFSLDTVITLFHRGDVAYFDGLSETILSVGLVKPKAGQIA